MNSPGFSVILPTYQRKECICAAVEALGRAEYDGSLEIIVVVDGSNDGTAEALRALRLPQPLTVIEQENRGLAGARNRGAHAACGEILLFLDDDMIAQSDIVRQHALMYRSGADAVHGAIPVHDDCPPNFLTQGIAAWPGCPPDGEPQGTTHSPFEIYGGHFSVRREVFERLGGFDETFTADGGYGSEDADFAARLLDGHTIAYNRQAISWHRFSVDAREMLKRAFRAWQAHVRFAQRHRRYSRELVTRVDECKLSNRLVYRPLARLPFLPFLLTRIVSSMCAMALKGEHRSHPLAARLFHSARQINYWAGVNSAGGFPPVEKARS